MRADARIAVAALLVAASSAPAWADRLQLPSVGGHAYSVPITSMRAARFGATLRQQYDFSCGSAALATLLTHQYGVRVSEQEVFEFMYAKGDQAKIRQEGFSLLDMKGFLAARGFAADGFEAPLDKLAEAGLPAIALISDGGYHHFVVVKGMRDDRLLVGDPAKGLRSLPRREFERMWQSKLLFVIHTSPIAPRFNADQEWRSAPLAPVAQGVQRDGIALNSFPRFATGDF